MNAPLHVYVFRDRTFSPSGDTVVCVAEQRQLKPFMTKKEVAHAFSGCATHKQYDTTKSWLLGLLQQNYVGVWGARNSSRLRRFLRERGAELVIHQDRPPHLRLAYYSTGNVRRRIRELPHEVE